MIDKGVWLSITEYSEYRNISISTIRRYIKGSQIISKKENGKYLIFVSDENLERKKINSAKENLKAKLECEELKLRLRMIEEENNDLKMLVQIYEKQINEVSTLPPVPSL